MNRLSDNQRMQVTKVQRVTVADMVFNQLRQQILSGGLSAGEPMPSERELCEAFGVGRTSVREALQGLLASGFVVRRGHRLIVADPSVLGAREVDYAALAARLSVREVYETRKLLEVKTAQLAAEHWTGSDLEALRAILDRMDTADEEAYHAADIDFHSTIARLSKNRVLAEVYEISKHLFFKLPAFWRVFGEGKRGRPNRRRIGTGKQGHQQIFDAIEARDVDAAGRIMFAHLDAVERGLIARLNPATAADETEPAPPALAPEEMGIGEQR